jgi:hypothetical protein
MLSSKFFVTMVALMLASVLAVSAETRAGRASTFAFNFKKSSDNVCGFTKKDLDRRFTRMYAALSSEDFDPEENCGKCVLVSGLPSSNSRRFVSGVFAQIVDSKDTISSGEILLSDKALSVSTRGSNENVVSWSIVDCPEATNLRGSRKLMEDA